MRSRTYAAAVIAAAAGGVVAAAARSGRRPVDLDTKVALVTGGSRGLGLLMARELGTRGCRVVVCARDAAELDRAVADLDGRGVQAHGLRCDLRDPAETEEVVRSARARFGRLDIVVNNAGIIQVGPQETQEEEHFREAMETMFWAPLRIARAALPELRANRGHLVNITSIGGKVSPPHLLPYACAKFAAVALSEGLDAEAAAHGVRVTTVVPGLMRTGSHRRAVFAGVPEREYTWFALAASLPLVSMDGEKAARRIIDAVARGRRYVVLTPMARAAMAVHGLLPSFTQTMLSTVDRMLPGPGANTIQSGLEAGAPGKHPLLRPFTVLNDRASRRFNQLPADSAPSNR